MRRGITLALLARLRHVLTHWDSRTLRGLLALMHLGFASACLLRPNLFVLFPVWAGFQDIASPAQWGWAAIMIAAGLLFAHPAGTVILLAEIASTIFFLAVSMQISQQTGYNTGTPTYGLLAMFSLVVLYCSGLAWLERQRWFREVRQRVDEQRGFHGGA